MRENQAKFYMMDLTSPFVINLQMEQHYLPIMLNHIAC